MKLEPLNILKFQKWRIKFVFAITVRICSSVAVEAHSVCFDNILTSLSINLLASLEQSETHLA